MTTTMSGAELTEAGNELLSGLMLKPWGQVSPSAYETGRLVSQAPWLVGHAERIAFLVAGQQSDGGWGAPDGYGLVPTLSATEALLSVLRRGDHVRDTERVGLVAERGLAALLAWQRDDGPLPDMPAIELVVPSLVALINRHLGGDPLRLPSGMSDAKLAVIRSRLDSGGAVPEKLVHALEVAGDAARGVSAVRPTLAGIVGASPAAAAAWLGDPKGPSSVRRHLEAVVRAHGGPVPVGYPITVFERGWVLSWLARTGVSVDVPPEMVADLRLAIGPSGTPAGPGLPADADTTSVALYALALLGAPCPPDSLAAYETDSHFCTWPGEEGSSVSVNAHVLDAYGQYARENPNAAGRYAAVIGKVSHWLCAHQNPDGNWHDRWHASPFYATASCVLALHEFGGGAARKATARAVRWVRATQRANGSWGRWTGTAEETAYAIQILLTRENTDWDAVLRGHAFLLAAEAKADHPPLWHDKDLYLPVSIVRAVILATRQAVRTRLAGAPPPGRLPSQVCTA
ncbi:prenyltransferase/squalene oxidase repeat-containing protein [Acrocarpospora sp. B8E8]|uniref:prenyltransferase/squalene oxidase repeat-containing protein n=1 Tax=Acrocarpospora sp. B8E8 TaxID=3153572 RepID=UPI00325CC4DD